MPVAGIQKSIYRNLFNRSFGGTKEPAVADMYISGFGYFWWEKLPDKLPQYCGLSHDEIKKTLCALTLRVTMPTETLNKTTVTGMGGKKWSVPTNIDVGDTLTIAFLELSGTPIRKIISGWVNMIRDIRTGTAQIEDTEYTKTKYSAAGYYITTKPDGKTVETVDYCTGMFPQKNPFDSFNLDVATNEKVEIDIDFNVDNIWPKELNDFVAAKAQQYITVIAEAKQTYMNWGGPASS